MVKDKTFNVQEPVRRQGIQALYTFTPFKLLRAGAGNYTLLLAPLAYFKTYPRLTWRSKSCKLLFEVPVSNFSKKVVQPYQLYPTTFQRDGRISYIYKRENIEDALFWKFPPTYIEFSWQALNSGYYCILGWTLLSSQQRCPQEKYCPNLRESPCRYYSKVHVSYPSLFNVYPRIQKKFYEPVDETMVSSILAIRYESKPLTVLRFTDHARFVMFVDGVIFSPKNARMLTYPTVLLKEGLGFRIDNVHAIELDFIPETLYELIENVLVSNVNDVARWIILKYKLYVEDREKYEFIREKRGFKGFDKLDEIVVQVVQGMKHSKSMAEIVRDVREIKITPEVIDFASFLFLHSLAHLLKHALVAKCGCRAEDIDYYVEHPKLRALGASSEKIRVILFETAIGGFGYIKSFVERIQGTNMLKELIFAAVRGLSRTCEDKVQKKLANLRNELGSFQYYKRLVDSIVKAYHDSFPNTSVYPHVNSIRRALVRVLSSLSEEERSLLDDLLAKGPHCWDGCQLCVMMEKGCTFLPFDQPFLVSERVLKAVLEKMLGMIEQPVCSFPLRRGVKKEFERALSAAKSNIDLVSPWISPEIIEKLVKLSEERDLKIRILTKIDPDNEVQVQSINRLTEISKKLSPVFQGRIIEELHAKGMLIDGVILLYGSFNFTNSGLDLNVENLVIDCSSHGTKSFKEEFDELWRRAQPLV